MGEVYRGVDTALNRPVAIKFLTNLADAEARRRFRREAELASSLNHPHILTVYSFGEFETQEYLITELIDGGTLREWVRSSPRSWRQVVELLVGVADALASAHAAGILHRDVKPANILIAGDGYAKLADFGLARAIKPADEEATIAAHTRAGVVVGTIAYMSPEQAAGKPLDARSDIFSFGAVLYEALTGRRPFGGATDLELLQTIIHRPAEPLPADLPMALRMSVDKALEHDPADRYQSMREMAVDLRRLLRQRSRETEVAALPSVGRRPATWMLVAAAAAVGVVALASVLTSARRNGGDPSWQNPLAGAAFARFTDFEGAEHDASISPDGKFVAFRADRDGPFDVWLAQVGTGRFVNLTHGSDDERRTRTGSLGFTADGSEIWLAGGPDRRLRLMPLLGGTPRVFLGEGVTNIKWSRDGQQIVYHTNARGVDPVFVADRTGANARQIFVGPYAGWHNHFPTWSPDGRWIYFVSGLYAAGEMDIWRVAVSGGTPERLTQHNSDVAYPTPLDDRTLLYVARDADGAGPWLWALDLDRKRTHRVSFGLEQYTSIAVDAGSRRLVATVANPSASLWSIPIRDTTVEEGDVTPYRVQTVNALAPRFGASSLFYLSSAGAGSGLWRRQDEETFEIWRGADGALFEPPAVSRDGRRVGIVLRRNGKLRLHVRSADGAELQPLSETIEVQGTGSWSPDGKWIVTGGHDANGDGLFKIAVDGSGPTRLVAGPALNPVWSGDGNLIVYAGPEVAGLMQLLAVHPDGGSVELPTIRVRAGDGERARFVPGTNLLVYMQGTLPPQDFWMLDIDARKTRQLTRLSGRAAMRTFDITPDGRQIVFDRVRENSDIVLIDMAAATAR